MASPYAQLEHRVRLEWGPIGAAGVDGWSPEASAAAFTFGAFRGSLSDVLRACSSGQELIGRGFGEDVDIAAELDSSPHVPLLRGDAFVRSTLVQEQ